MKQDEVLKKLEEVRAWITERVDPRTRMDVNTSIEDLRSLVVNLKNEA